MKFIISVFLGIITTSCVSFGPPIQVAQKPRIANFNTAQEDIASFNIANKDTKCCKHCSAKSQACGDSCISLKKTCHKLPGCAC